MASRSSAFIVHPALGGLDSTTASTVLGLTNPGALTIAENITYDNSGARKKRPGTDRYNGTAVTGDVAFTAMKDFWRYGTSRTPTQKFVATAGALILKDDGDGVWDTLKSSWGDADAQACITIGQGHAIFSTTNGTDAPQTWDGSTQAALGGSPPVFAFSAYHQRRLWVAGTAAAMSGLRCSAGGDIATWSGGDQTTLTLDEDDGDAIVGISKTFRRRLYVFKGPNMGSVWEIGGSTISDYTRNKVIEGAPAINHNSIITTPNDIYWLSTTGVHSLVATEKYGDTQETYLSRPIETTFHQLNFSQIKRAYGAWHPTENYVCWAVPESGSSTNSMLLVYFYLTQQWATWHFSGFDPACVAVMRDPASASREQRLYIGGYDGFCREGDEVTFSDDDLDMAYTATVRGPVYVRFPRADEMTEKSIESVRTFFRPTSGTATLSVNVDGRITNYDVSMDATSGATWDTVNWDEFEWAGNDLNYVDTPTPERGTAIELTYAQAGEGDGLELYGWGIRYAPGETHALDGVSA